jgi:hypothetical protein
VVVTISNPRLEGQNLTYDVKTLEGDLPKTGPMGLMLRAELRGCPPQNLARREMLGAMLARMTNRTELGRSRTLPTARHARVERGIRLSPTQYAQLCMDCRRRSESCCRPKLVPLFNESGKLVPTSRRWGHHLCPAWAGLLLCKRSPRIEGRASR